MAVKEGKSRIMISLTDELKFIVRLVNSKFGSGNNWYFMLSYFEILNS